MKLLNYAIWLLVSVAPPSWADTTALTSTRTVGNQSFGGALGMDFDVFSPILITQLGAFDSAQNGFVGNIQVGIFNRDTQAIVASPATLSGIGGTLVGSYRFSDVSDFLLSVGRYSIVAVGFNNLDLNGNVYYGGLGPVVNTGVGLITFVGASRWTSTQSLVLPSNIDGQSVTAYDAGNFQFVSSPVPEIATSTLLLLGLCVLGIAALRLRASTH